MTSQGADRTEAKESLDTVLVACLEAIEEGRPPDREALLARYPEFAAELREFLDGHERLDRCTAPVRAALAWVEPESFGDYELLGQIARGGTAVVWKARQRSLNRLVAIKVIGTGVAAPADALARMRNEAEIVAALDHPHIAPIHEVGEQNGRLYLSMKLFAGGSLADHLPRYVAEPREAARLVATVAWAVHHAHQRGVLHLDLKPSNILLDDEGRPHVADFGLAKRAEGDAGLTQTGAIVGTPGYMSPEQASGRRGTVTVAADVYGLGAVLFALLTGQPPFRGETVLESLERVRSREPEPPSGSNSRVSRDLETVCLKCLEKDPQRRYPSAEALAEDLERWMRGEPVVARRVGAVGRLWRWAGGTRCSRRFRGCRRGSSRSWRRG
jgi:serine/threonine-protein kinase